LGKLSFSPDSQRLITFGGQPTLWDVLIAPTPVPSWFCDLVEAVGGARLTDDGQLQMISQEAVGELRKRVAANQEKDFYARWAKWFLLDRMHDTAPPCPMP
jgi:hypothetical protein